MNKRRSLMLPLIGGFVAMLASCTQPPTLEEARELLEDRIAAEPRLACSELKPVRVQEIGDDALRYMFEGACLDLGGEETTESPYFFSVPFERTLRGWEAGEIERLGRP